MLKSSVGYFANMCSNIGFMYQLYVTIFNWLISGYTLESELIILSGNFCKKSIVHTWGSLQSEFLYVENAFQKLAIALPFWNNKTRQMGPKTNSNGVHTPDTLRGGVWSNVLVGSIRCAWPGGLSMLPSQNRSQRLRILYIPVSVRGLRRVRDFGLITCVQHRRTGDVPLPR